MLSGSCLKPIRVSLAGAVLVMSGAITLFASEFWAALLLVLAAVPGCIGMLQMLAGMRLIRRRGRALALVMSAIGILLGLAGLSGSTLPAGVVGPSVGLWRSLLGGTVVAANAIALAVALRDLPPAESAPSRNSP